MYSSKELHVSKNTSYAMMYYDLAVRLDAVIAVRVPFHIDQHLKMIGYARAWPVADRQPSPELQTKNRK